MLIAVLARSEKKGRGEEAGKKGESGHEKSGLLNGPGKHSGVRLQNDAFPFLFQEIDRDSRAQKNGHPRKGATASLKKVGTTYLVQVL